MNAGRQQYTKPHDLDPFSAKLFKGVAPRFNEAKRRHFMIERTLWLGTMLSEFSDAELRVLAEVGVMCQLDVMDIERARGLRDGPPGHIEVTFGGAS